MKAAMLTIALNVLATVHARAQCLDAPFAPHLGSPAADTSLAGTWMVGMSWSAGSRGTAQGYLSQASPDPNFASGVKTGTSTALYSANFTQLTNGVRYYFRVAGVVNSPTYCVGAWSPVLNAVYGTAPTPTPAPAPAGWSSTSYAASTDIAVGRNGAVWFINGTAIYQVNPSGPQAVPGAAVFIAVDPNGWPWVVNGVNDIYKWTGSNWQLMPGKAIDIGIGSNGAVWILGTDGVPAKWNGSAWVKSTGVGTRISVGPDGNPWVVTASSSIHQWTGSAWKLYPGLATDISVGPDGTVYVKTGAGTVFRWDPALTWVQEAGVVGTAVAAGSGLHAWVARAGGTVIKR